MATEVYDQKVYEEDQMNEDDKRLFVQFFVEAVEDKLKSVEEGRPIFREVVNVRIIAPGSRDSTVTRATLHYQNRFQKQWDRFKKALEQTHEGTPLEQVPWLTVGVIAELKAMNCFSLEQLAGMSDSLASRMMGMHSFRQKAQAFLQAAKEAAPFTKMQAQLEERDVQIGVLQEQVKQLMAANAAKKE
jgi:hypothetical protein